MELWNEIVNVAMVGTDKRNIRLSDLSDALKNFVELIHANSEIDKEEKFLQTAVLTQNYRLSGTMPLLKETATLAPAPSEENIYCSYDAIQVLKDILSEESEPLLVLWLQHCLQKQQIVLPALLPSLLSLAVQHKSLQLLVAVCCGNRGKWLSNFNPDWNFSQRQSEDELWKTGTAEQRRKILSEIRKADPIKAVAWLQESWPQEDAISKVSFLEILLINISANDIPFLEAQASEKSKKVKDEATVLLKRISESSIVQLYKKALSELVEIKKEKTLLGLSSKLVFGIKTALAIDDAIYKFGIEKLSSTKEFTDEEYIVYQLIKSVPPVYLENLIGETPEKIINFFQNDVKAKKMILALVLSIVNFNDKRWAFILMQSSHVFYTDLIPLLPLQQQEYYSNKYFNEQPESILHYALQREQEWGIELTVHIFNFLAKNPYAYNRSFYNQHIHLIPSAILSALSKCTPSDDNLKTMWSNSSDYINKLVTLKIQITKVFKD